MKQINTWKSASCWLFPRICKEMHGQQDIKKKYIVVVVGLQVQRCVAVSGVPFIPDVMRIFLIFLSTAGWDMEFRTVMRTLFV
jgi:hypothetical protein